MLFHFQALFKSPVITNHAPLESIRMKIHKSTPTVLETGRLAGLRGIYLETIGLE